jgi:hypothetical protein
VILHRTIIVIALAIFLVAPAGYAKKTKTTTADYFPLRVGDTWTYRNSESGGYTWKVLSEEPRDGVTVRYIVEVLSGVKILNTFSKSKGWVLFHAESYPEHEGLQATYEPPKQYLPNPLAVGQKWQWTGKDPTQVERHENSRVVGIETVTVPAGKFRAMKVVSEINNGGGLMTKSSWYASGVGLVKTETLGGGIRYGSELTDYSFKKSPPK